MTQPREISDELLDCLVDGELPDAERRALLLSLDARPDEWRRCALAFLEAQTWKAVLSDTVRGDTTRGDTLQSLPKEAVATALPHKEAFAWRTCLAAAASFLLAFGLATWLNHRPAGDEQTPSDNHNLVANVPSTNNDSANKGATPMVATAAPDPAPMKTPETIRLTLAGQGNEQQAIDLPIVNDAQQLQALFAENPDVLPSYLRERIERTGHKIEQRRELVPIELNDGRQIVVPVDQVEVRYVGNRSVQ